MKQEVQKKQEQQEIQKIQAASFAVPDELKTSVSDIGIQTIASKIISVNNGKIKVRDEAGEVSYVQEIKGVILHKYRTFKLRRAAAFPQKKELLESNFDKWPENEKQILAMAVDDSFGNIDERIFRDPNLRKGLEERFNLIMALENGEIVRVVSGSTLGTRFKRYAVALKLKNTDPVVCMTRLTELGATSADGKEYSTFEFHYAGGFDKGFFDKNVVPNAKIVREIIEGTKRYYESLPSVYFADSTIESTALEAEISDESIPF